MKYKIVWQATYETTIEAGDLEAAEREGANVEIDVPGSQYVDDSWEVLSMRPMDS